MGQVLVSNDTPPAPRVVLPTTLTAVVGEELRVYTRGAIESVDPYAMPHNWSCNIGKNYRRYFSVTPTSDQVGSHDLSATVTDLRNTTLSTAAATLEVVEASGQPAAQKNILCIGDSLTSDGSWPQEMYRRLTQADGTPAGLSYDNIDFVGNRSMPNYAAQKYVGIGGFTISGYRGVGDRTAKIVHCVNANLLADPGLETWSSGKATSWPLAYNLHSYFQDSSVRPGSSGMLSLKMVTSGTIDGTSPYIAQNNIAVTPDATYTLSYWTKCDGTHPGRHAVWDHTHSAYIAGHLLGAGTNDQASASWIRVTHSVTIPTGCTSIGINLTGAMSTQNAEVWYDDVSFSPVLETHGKDSRDVGSLYADSSGNHWEITDYDALNLHMHCTVVVDGILPATGTLTRYSGGTNTGTVIYDNAITAIHSPFVDFETGDYSISAWATRHAITSVHVLYLFLAWNDMSATSAHAEANGWTSHLATLGTFLGELQAVFEDIECIRVMGPQIPSEDGGGDDYGASSVQSHYFDVLRATNGYRIAVNEYVADVLPAYARFVDLAMEIDAESSYGVDTVAVNPRSEETETRQNSGVHLAVTGYYQIADTMTRDFLRTYCSG